MEGVGCRGLHGGYQRGVEREAVAEDGEILAHALPPARAHPKTLLERRLRRVQHPACWRARPNLCLVALGCFLRRGELRRAQRVWKVEIARHVDEEALLRRHLLEVHPDIVVLARLRDCVTRQAASLLALSLDRDRLSHSLLSYAKQYCRYGMEVAMLTGTTVR